MKSQNVADYLWGKRAKLLTLACCAFILIFACLGARDIWTQEHRWADIVAGMFYRHDFLHPYLGLVRYYDKPLLSYWLIAFGVNLAGVFNSTILRLPSALAGMLAIFAIFSLGRTLKSKQFGLLAGWMLLSTFYFVYWARVSSADMLNLAGSLCAIAWYMEKRSTISIFNYTVFFLIVALTSLCKGLVAAIIVFLAVAVDLLLDKSSRRHVNKYLFLSAIPSVLLYFFPFWLSSHFDSSSYGDSGLYLVYKENILRYFKPFDHQGHWYTYLIYLPVYTAPWAIFLIPALYSLKKRWQDLSINSRWIATTLLVLFIFFSLSGSRRSYYVLPMVPFALLLIADWIWLYAERVRIAAVLTVGTLIVSLIVVDLIPAWYYTHYGASVFADIVKDSVIDWSPDKVILLDTESKLNFYLKLPPQTPTYPILGYERLKRSTEKITNIFPVLVNLQPDTIIITRKLYEGALLSYLKGYTLVELSNYPELAFLKDYKENGPIAFVPLNKKKT